VETRLAQLCEGETPDSFVWRMSGYTSAKDAKREEERQKARELRAAGKSSREIAEIMGIGKTKAAELMRATPVSEITAP